MLDESCKNPDIHNGNNTLDQKFLAKELYLKIQCQYHNCNYLS